MPRRARVIVQDTPHHIVQRGHNRSAVFVEERDYQYYLDTLGEFKEELEVKVYAWCLMTNHIHLILDPGPDAKSIGLLMKRLAECAFIRARVARNRLTGDGKFVEEVER